MRAGIEVPRQLADESYIMRAMQGLKLFLIFSIFLHLLFSLTGVVISRWAPLPPREMAQAIEVEMRTDSSADELKSRQFVEQNEKALNNELDPNAKYLSRHNQKVIKQSIASQRGQFQNQKSAPSAPAPSSAQKNISTTAEPSIAKFLPKFDLSEQVDQEAVRVDQMAQKLLENQKVKTPEAQARPDSQNSDPSMMSQTLDYIKDLDPGLETLLTTREFVYYTYYARIRNQLNQYWTPKVQETVKKIYSQGRSIASNADKITRCLVILDKKGVLQKIQIIGESGIRDLDEAAAEAFRSAAPFPNPPAGMIDPDGTIKIRWDFVLEA